MDNDHYEYPEDAPSADLGRMTPERAAFFLRRFKADEKMLGPNEQAALDAAILALTSPATQGAAVAYLCEGARFKLSPSRSGASFDGFPRELAGRWVALVDATDNAHMRAAPAASPRDGELAKPWPPLPTAQDVRAAIDLALSDSIAAIKVLSTILRKKDLRSFAVADEILGNVINAQKLLAAAPSPATEQAGAEARTMEAVRAKLSPNEWAILCAGFQEHYAAPFYGLDWQGAPIYRDGVPNWDLKVEKPAPVGADAVERVSDAMVSRAARALADRQADECNVDREDNWKVYGDSYMDDARAMLEAATQEGG